MTAKEVKTLFDILEKNDKLYKEAQKKVDEETSIGNLIDVSKALSRWLAVSEVITALVTPEQIDALLRD